MNIRAASSAIADPLKVEKSLKICAAIGVFSTAIRQLFRNIGSSTTEKPVAAKMTCNGYDHLASHFAVASWYSLR